MKMTIGQGSLFGAAILLAPLAMFAQVPSGTGSGTQNPTPSQVGGQMTSANPMDSSLNGSVSNDTQLVKDKMFVRKATEGGFAEVQFGQLAAQKASSEDVKKLGQKLVDDRTQLDANLKPVADDLGVRMPAKLAKTDQEEFDKLKGLSGADFDKEYMSAMVSDHAKALDAFTTEAKDTKDLKFRAVVLKGKTVVAAHKNMAYDLKKKL